MVLLLRKLYLYFTKDPEKSIIFQGGGGFQLLPGGSKCYFYSNPYIYLVFSRGGGGVRTPYPTLGPHMGNIIITGQYLLQSGL